MNKMAETSPEKKNRVQWNQTQWSQFAVRASYWEK